ncbi:hypothetical protein RND81_13G060000 [Saponaria officinalis]|uniref:ATP-dependent DNA helicase n=1 Tax=Saponaria officinalis TaxID=3572 RepID=A0AAW1GUF4_SAPOF
MHVKNRPDLVARVFRAKLLALKKQIIEKQISGEVAALVYVVEFQKRGLPHAHFLIILKPEFKIKCIEDYDKFISVENPPEAEAHLGKSVLRHMMHGPCGPLNPECPCMKHPSNIGRCKYEFPKKMTDTTTNNAEGYPVYQRRETGETAFIRKHRLNNGWVIPYNPYLLALFDCHLNIEVCSILQAVKYLYKYVYKGHEKIAFNVLQNNVSTTVSPCEAALRIFGFDLFQMHPPVMPLPIHQPNMQSVRVRPLEKLDQIVLSERRTITPLIEFFRTNEINGGTWLLRKNKLIVVGRLAVVAPAEGERYFLRLLLLHVRGPQSFEDLMTIDGYRCATFQKVALKHRLLEEDDVVEMCLKEASEVQMPFAVRRLFATLLVFCQPSNLLKLWTDYYNHLSEDFTKINPNNPEKARCLTVRSVEQYLEAMDKTQKAFDRIILHVRDKIPEVFFVDGPGGTGKTFLYNALYGEVRLMGKIVLPTATSGLLALIREADLLIWDEASMARKENIESLEVFLRDLCNPKLPFWGKVIVFGGDFCQILQVVPPKSFKEAVSASLVTSHLWPGMIRFRLVENIHAREYPEFSRFLLALGNGELQHEEEGYVEVPANIVKSTDSEHNDPLAEITSIRFINKLCPRGMSPHNLVLKENYLVILLINILPSFGLCNGTRLVCSRFFPNLINCIIITGHHKGEHAFIPRVKLRPSTSNGYPFHQTLNKVAIYMRQPCFSPGQLCVALSWARKSTHVLVFATKQKNRLPITYLKKRCLLRF